MSTVSNSKQSAMIGCLRARVRKQPIISLYFEFETVLKSYNLGVWSIKMYVVILFNYTQGIEQNLKLVHNCIGLRKHFLPLYIVKKTTNKPNIGHQGDRHINMCFTLTRRQVRGHWPYTAVSHYVKSELVTHSECKLLIKILKDICT